MCAHLFVFTNENEIGSIPLIRWGPWSDGGKAVGVNDCMATPSKQALDKSHGDARKGLTYQLTVRQLAPVISLGYTNLRGLKWNVALVTGRWEHGGKMIGLSSFVNRGTFPSIFP